MSLKLIKKNSSSPFHLQRSIVPQGDEDGAYSKGGYNPEAVYNNDAANEAMESFSKTIGAALSNMDFGKKKNDAPTADAGKKGSAPNKPEKIFNIEDQVKSNYSDYSEQSMMPLSKEEKKRKDFELARSRYENREEKKRKGFELARSAYEKQEEEKQKKKNPLSGFYF